jgi:hypothetical protein
MLHQSSKVLCWRLEDLLEELDLIGQLLKISCRVLKVVMVLFPWSNPYLVVLHKINLSLFRERSLFIVFTLLYVFSITCI